MRVNHVIVGVLVVDDLDRAHTDFHALAHRLPIVRSAVQIGAQPNGDLAFDAGTPERIEFQRRGGVVDTLFEDRSDAGLIKTQELCCFTGVAKAILYPANPPLLPSSNEAVHAFCTS